MIRKGLINRPPRSQKTSDDESLDQSTWRAFGTVVDGEGKPFRGVMIRVAAGFDTLTDNQETTTDGDGRYDLRFGKHFSSLNENAIPLPQTNFARVTAHLEGRIEKNYSLHGNGYLSLQPKPANPVNLPQYGRAFIPNRPREINFVMLPVPEAPLAKVRGILIGENREPLADYSVYLTADELPPGQSLLSQVRTDDQGRFKLTEIPTSIPYQFVVRKPADKLQPPWNDSWASGPITFRDPGDADFATAIDTKQVSIDRLTAENFRVQIKGGGQAQQESSQACPGTRADLGRLRRQPGGTVSPWEPNKSSVFFWR